MATTNWDIRVGEYLLGNCIGGGQYSKVREAQKGNTCYAFKYIKLTECPKENAKYQGLITTEANAMAKIEHPNILRLVDHSTRSLMLKQGGKNVPVAYLVFELMTNGELIGYIQLTGRLSESIARFYFRQLIEAVEYLHLQGFAHRDIKAENMLLDESFQLKLSDFGFAAPIRGKDNSGHLHTYKGTYRYMAPEIHALCPYSGEKVDIFACGVLLFIMVVGVSPFISAKVEDKNYIDLHRQKESFWDKVIKLNKNLELSEEFKDLFQWLVHFEPENRPSIAEIKNHSWSNSNFTATPNEVFEEFNKRKGIIKEAQNQFSAIKNAVHNNLTLKLKRSLSQKSESSSKKKRAVLVTRGSKNIKSTESKSGSSKKSIAKRSKSKAMRSKAMALKIAKKQPKKAKVSEEVKEKKELSRIRSVLRASRRENIVKRNRARIPNIVDNSPDLDVSLEKAMEKSEMEEMKEDSVLDKYMEVSCLYNVD